MLISINNITKTFIDKTVLNDVSFHLNEHDKCALIGINGCGKTTLLNIIINEVLSRNILTGDENVYRAHAISPDSGTVTMGRELTVGYLPQNAMVESGLTIYEEVRKVKKPLLDMQEKLRRIERSLGELSGSELDKEMESYHSLSEEFNRLGGYMIDSEIGGTLKGMGFDDDKWDVDTGTLSGGQKTRVALAKLLVSAPDLIILDEPTNHLDISSITWLENYLHAYKGAVLIVSHDRYFLDRIVNKVVNLENGRATVFTGNYTDYAAKKEILRVSELNAYISQQRDIRHQKEVIEKLRSFNREKSVKRADSRQKLLDKTKILDKPTELNDRMQIVLTPRIESGKDVLMIEGLSKSYDRVLFKDADIMLRRGEHVAVIGDNGTGKTTLLKIITGLVCPDTGKVRFGSNVQIGYYDQEQHVLDDDKTIYDEISDAFPTLKETEIRNTLAAFLFTKEEVYKRISSLSGGEKGRVSLAKLMLSEANLLILDEPTNHLDMTSKEILESAINNYTGTLLYVSHDRYFINRTADRILELSNTVFTEYQGDYDYYLEKSGMAGEPAAVPGSEKNDTGNNKAASGGAADYKAGKLAAAEYKRKQNRINELENEISRLEQRIDAIDTELSDPANGTDTEKLMKLQNERDAAEAGYLEAMEEWEKLVDNIANTRG